MTCQCVISVALVHPIRVQNIHDTANNEKYTESRLNAGPLTPGQIIAERDINVRKINGDKQSSFVSQKYNSIQCYNCRN